MALLGAVAEADDPVAAALEVVGDLLDRLGRDLGDPLVLAMLQPVEQEPVPGVEEELAGHGDGEVAVLLLDQQHGCGRHASRR